MGTKIFCNRQCLLIFVWILALALCGYEITIFKSQLSSESVGTDFIAYWASARLMIAGENPYDSNNIFTLQKSKGTAGETPLVMYNHPWALGLILPFGWDNYVLSKFLWLCFLFALLTLCADWLWHIYAGTIRKRLSSLILINFNRNDAWEKVTTWGGDYIHMLAP